MAQSRIFHDGQEYYSIAGAAENLRTNTTKVRQLMGAGDLEYVNFRNNGKLFIPALSLLAYKEKGKGTKS